MTCTVTFAYPVGARVRVKATRLEGEITALHFNDRGMHLVQIRDTGGTYHWQREEELQRVEP